MDQILSIVGVDDSLESKISLIDHLLNFDSLDSVLVDQLSKLLECDFLVKTHTLPDVISVVQKDGNKGQNSVDGLVLVLVEELLWIEVVLVSLLSIFIVLFWVLIGKIQYPLQYALEWYICSNGTRLDTLFLLNFVDFNILYGGEFWFLIEIGEKSLSVIECGQ